MTIELNDHEIEAICFAYTRLHFDYLLNHTTLQEKPKAHLLDAIKTLGTIVDRIEQQQKEDEKVSWNTDA